MTPELTDLVHQSLPKVLALQDRAPALFQEQFVALDPAPRPLFAGLGTPRAARRLLSREARSCRGARRPSATSCARAPRD